MSLRISLTLMLATFLTASLLVARADASKQGSPSATTPTEEANLFAKTYLLAPPLPTSGRVSADEQNLRQAQKRQQERQDEAKAFSKTYRLAQPFAVASLESRKPAQATQRFERQTKLPDPMEKINRSAFRTTVFIEKTFYRPLARGWRKIPRPLSAPVVNFARNLSRTTSFLNALAQGNSQRASEVFFAFVLDSTLGFGGLINLSKHLGIPQVEEDFGQTLAHYGFGHGAYFVSFFTGPSSLRDTAGGAVDITADILLIAETGVGLGVGAGISVGMRIIKGIDDYSQTIDQIEALEQGSLDLYIATRRFYAYRRALQVLNAESLPSAQELASPVQSYEDDPFGDIIEE